MYSIAATGKWPDPIAMSRQFTDSTAAIFAASVALPATAASRMGPSVCATMYCTTKSGV